MFQDSVLVCHEIVIENLFYGTICHQTETCPKLITITEEKGVDFVWG